MTWKIILLSIGMLSLIREIRNESENDFLIQRILSDSEQEVDKMLSDRIETDLIAGHFRRGQNEA